MAASASVWRNTRWVVVRSRRMETSRRSRTWSTTVSPSGTAIGAPRYPNGHGRLAPVSAPRRNVELKATDPDPQRSLAVCLELGAEDRGVIVQRDTYFRVPTGRLKLRE